MKLQLEVLEERVRTRSGRRSTRRHTKSSQVLPRVSCAKTRCVLGPLTRTQYGAHAASRSPRRTRGRCRASPASITCSFSVGATSPVGVADGSPRGRRVQPAEHVAPHDRATRRGPRRGQRGLRLLKRRCFGRTPITSCKVVHRSPRRASSPEGQPAKPDCQPDASSPFVQHGGSECVFIGVVADKPATNRFAGFFSVTPSPLGPRHPRGPPPLPAGAAPSFMDRDAMALVIASTFCRW